jgi:hypothetical protein
VYKTEAEEMEALDGKDTKNWAQDESTQLLAPSTREALSGMLLVVN